MGGYATPRVRSILSAAWPAVLAAGPLFVTATAGAALYLQLPQAVIVEPWELLGFAMILGPAIMIGTLLAVGPITLAAALLRNLGARYRALRSAPVWALVGGSAGTLLIQAVDPGVAEQPLVCGMMTTSAVCALWTRRRLYSIRECQVPCEQGPRQAAEPSVLNSS